MEKSFDTERISYEELDAAEIGKIEPLWNRLNRFHEQKSIYFKSFFKNFRFEERVRRLTSEGEKRLRIIVAVKQEKKQRVGYCISSIDKDNKGEIESIFVEEKYRSKRIGFSFMEDAIHWFEENKVKDISIVVAYGNEKALDFYRKFDFYPRTLVLRNRKNSR